MFLYNFYADYFNALAITIFPGLTLLILFFIRDKNKEPFSMVISTFAMAFIITMPLDLLNQIVFPILLSLFASSLSLGSSLIYCCKVIGLEGSNGINLHK